MPLWTGSELYLLGETNSARIDLSDPRRETPIANPPVLRFPVWTGSELFMLTVDNGIGGSVYSPATDTWQEFARITPISAGGIVGTVMVDGRLYFVAYTDGGGGATVLSYAPDTDTWQEFAEIATPGQGGALLPPVALGDSIVFFAAFGTGYRYEISTNTWAEMPPLPGATAGGVTVTLGGGAFSQTPPRTAAVDGLMVALAQDKLMIFDPVQSTWITGPTAPRAIGLLSTPGALYATTADGSIMRLRY